MRNDAPVRVCVCERESEKGQCVYVRLPRVDGTGELWNMRSPTCPSLTPPPEVRRRTPEVICPLTVLNLNLNL